MDNLIFMSDNINFEKVEFNGVLTTEIIAYESGIKCLLTCDKNMLTLKEEISVNYIDPSGKEKTMFLEKCIQPIFDDNSLTELINTIDNDKISEKVINKEFEARTNKLMETYDNVIKYYTQELSNPTVNGLSFLSQIASQTVSRHLLLITSFSITTTDYISEE